MKTSAFQTLLYGANLESQQIQVGIKGFADFYHNLTPKHQEKTELIIFLDDSKANLDVFKRYITNYEIESSVKFELFSSKGISDYFLSANILILINDKSIQKPLTMAFETALPIIGASTPTLKRMVDFSCGILIDEDMNDDFANEMSHFLDMIYHDPDGRQVLRKGMRIKAMSM